MKKEKFDFKVTEIISKLYEWCKKENYSFNQYGKYSVFLNITDKNISGIKEKIHDYLTTKLKTTKKKIKKLFSILVMDNRLYILFKAPSQIL